jgi:hypothetical protein
VRVRLSGYVAPPIQMGVGLAEECAFIYMLVNTTAVRSSELRNVPRHRPEGSKGIESILRLRGTQEDMWKVSLAQWFLPW